MMLGVPMRLAIAYGLIALIVLAAIVVAWWCWQHTDRAHRRRERAKEVERYRRRDATAGNARSTTGGTSE